MLKMTVQQCQDIGQMEDYDLIRDTARRIRMKYPQVTESDITYIPRLKLALEYANSLPLYERKSRRDFMLLETFYPSFYMNSAVNKWLCMSNGYTAEQRLSDYKHVMINRERRKI